MSEKILTIRLLEEKYGVCRLNNNESIPEWIKNSDFFSITKTCDELSIVCLEKDMPDEVKCEKEWRILKVEGQLDFSLVGILSSISTILAKSGIGIFAISTYDTDYILVKEKDVDNAMKALIKNKYDVIV
ncbi:amino acid-binding protein [Clostridium beijerinckii]|uniref:Amino acid-binding protein n=1 Tax=Clostridium beijerinckii TaxID=1520 RepID=A0A0B5QDK7_CLOBE|nr:ACT domain-containing protein [Clostridium beijerinckii]AJH00305.1 amino acid-binding protein [Clostridium beijerinckii]